MGITRLRGIGVLSAGKVGAILYAGIGLVVGTLIACASLLGLFAALRDQPGAGAISGVLGVGAVIILPIFYGIVGAIGLMIVAVLYNLAARVTGGLELELD